MISCCLRKRLSDNVERKVEPSVGVGTETEGMSVREGEGVVDCCYVDVGRWDGVGGGGGRGGGGRGVGVGGRGEGGASAGVEFCHGWLSDGS